MKKKISIIALCVAVAGVIAYFPIKTALGGNDVMSQWGKILSDDSKNETSGSKGKFRIATDGPAAQTYSASDEIFAIFPSSNWDTLHSASHFRITG